MHAVRNQVRTTTRLLASVVAVVVLVGLAAAGVRGGSASPEPAPSSPVTPMVADVAGASFLPVDTVAYVELRGDLPAGQGDALTEVLTRFPGFASTPGSEAEVDRALEALLADASDGALSWTRDIRAWFGGRASLGLMDDRAALFAGSPSLLAGFEVTDPAAAQAFTDGFVEMVVGDVPDAIVEEAYRGVTVVSSNDGAWAYALSDDLLLLGSGTDEVHTGLDVLAGEAPSLSTREAFQTAFDRMPEGRLAAGYLDAVTARSYIEALMLLMPEPTLEAVAGLLEAWPVDLAFWLSARPDGMILQTVATPGPGTPTVVSGEPHLAQAFPTGTLLLVEVPDLGRSLVEAVRWMAPWLPNADLGATDVLVASIDNLVGWAGDVAIGAGIDGAELWLGGVIETGEPAAADVYVGAAQAIIGLAWLALANDPYGPGPRFTTQLETTEAATVTTVSFAEAVRGMELPLEPSVSIAQVGDRVVVGTSALVTASLGLTEDDSLATDARYVEALIAAGGADAGHVYLDLHGVWQALAPLLMMRSEEVREIAPYVEPLDRVVFAYGVEDDGATTTTLLLLVR